REIKPTLKVLKEVSSLDTPQTEEEKHFVEQTTKLYDFVLKADNVLDKMTEYRENWLTRLLMKFVQ
ncbi:MAG TPA: transcriptional regulator, partial [Mangrovimonas sp.]|nr:transcriptional regulator [Mangrovimonas sp.]